MTTQSRCHSYPRCLKSFKLTFRDVKVEEVTIENSLDDPSHDGNHVKEALKVEPPEPVEEVEGAVDPQAEQIVGSDGLGLAGLANHKELRQDGHRLKVDGKGPQNLMIKLKFIQV